MVETLYSAACDGNFITPTGVVQFNLAQYQGYTIYANCDSGTGTLRLLHLNGIFHSAFSIEQRNDLWFHQYNVTPPCTLKVHRMNNLCLSALWHGRLACTGNSCMDIMHKYVKGIDRPLQIRPFYKCASYPPKKCVKDLCIIVPTSIKIRHAQYVTQNVSTAPYLN